MRRSVRLAALVMALAALSASPAAAVTNGEPDGNGHPSVGALVVNLPQAGQVPVCSGTLIAPAVFLTAAHCTAWLPSLGIGQVSVTFDSTLDPARWTLTQGTYVTDPAFGHDRADLHDLAVVLLSQPVAGIAPASLPPAGLLDRTFARRRPDVTSVGYGFYARETGGGPPQWLYDGLRRVSTSPVAALTPTWLRLLTSAQATGQGGVCFGDSGGPQFLGGSSTVVAVTSGGDAACAGSSASYRLDSASARAFLGRFVQVP